MGDMAVMPYRIHIYGLQNLPSGYFFLKESLPKSIRLLRATRNYCSTRVKFTTSTILYRSAFDEAEQIACNSCFYYLTRNANFSTELHSQYIFVQPINSYVC
ncbi:hypothetical protein NUACC26_078290 [Scytonema sp. NUACC26]